MSRSLRDVGDSAKHRCWFTGRQTQCRPTHSNHCSRETTTCQGCTGRKRTIWTLSEVPSEMNKSPRRRHACVGRLQVDVRETSRRDATRERCEWLHVQSTDRSTSTVWCPCVARPTERGESENVTKQTYPGTATMVTWTLAIHNAASRNCRDAFAMKSESWSPRVVVPKAADPRQRSKNGRFLYVAAEGRLRLNEISMLNENPLQTREVMEGKEIYSKVKPSVWTNLKEDSDARPMKQNTHVIPTGSTNKRKNRTEEGERPRSRSRSASSLSDM